MADEVSVYSSPLLKTASKWPVPERFTLAGGRKMVAGLAPEQ